jgi:hypothetical protein
MAKHKKLKELYPIGQKLYFHTGNFSGLNGIVKKVKENVKDAIFGFIIEVELSNGKTGYIEKSEHFTKVMQ